MHQALFGGRAAEDHPPARDLDALLFERVRQAPDSVLFHDDTGSATAQGFATRVAWLADQYRQCGLQPGDRILLVTGADVRSLVALFAALRAGLEPSLAPCGLGPVELAAHARAADAVAMTGPTHYGTLALGDAYLSAAALSDTIRLVATTGPGTIDGAADFSQIVSDGGSMGAREPLQTEAAAIVTFEGPASAPVPVANRQTALFASAAALVDQARITSTAPILSTIVPARFAGLVAGPFAALIGASGLALQGPFGSKAFLAVYDAAPNAHLVVPAEAALPMARLDRDDETAALVLLSRFPSPTGFVLPRAFDCRRRVVDLYAFGETACLARARDGHLPQTPAELSDGSLPGRLGVALNRARSDSRAAG